MRSRRRSLRLTCTAAEREEIEAAAMKMQATMPEGWLLGVERFALAAVLAEARRVLATSPGPAERAPSARQRAARKWRPFNAGLL